MIIEIGTSDFRTQAGQVDGVFIEPVKYYFDRMVELVDERDPAGTNYGAYENVAISDYEGDVDMYTLPPDTIEHFELPQWLRGCSRIGEPHPSALVALVSAGLPSTLLEAKSIKVLRIKSIIDKYNITSLDLLKIDTEGHDCIILNDYLNTVEILPKVIQFESNELSDPKEVAKVVARLKPLGYDCKQVKFDMVCKRN